ncbi:ferritin-like domain-containing protein [Acidicapsa dinghuensis]|uniref:Ferritin-like domain-containing protein n=1 Tax=Acidicapsa dinghuensis TaxID=2218256 RepID=A0ABW1EL08_9BACT|nr:ferritin-like domain-containing protein [Acidicapsa dinghuensis]
MNAPNEIEAIRLSKQGQSGSSRRSFLQGAALTGATAFAVLGGLSTVASASAAEQEEEPDSMRYEHDHLKKDDRDILIAAQIAEALAVTTYSNIIDTSPFFKTIPDDDQGYLIGARQEEMSHYLLEQSVTDQPTPFTEFFYPHKMFSDAQTTLDILVTLEDAFIAAYLVGVRNFSTRNLRVTAARILGIESDHRTLARVVGGDVTPQFGGPISSITGIQGVAESIAPPNNNGYERTLCWTSINQALTALTPFVSFNAAKAAGFDTSQSFPFEPFNPTLPNPLGDFISFKGC